MEVDINNNSDQQDNYDGVGNARDGIANRMLVTRLIMPYMLLNNNYDHCGPSGNPVISFVDSQW